MHGDYGIYTFTDGRKYIGTYVRDKKHGEGVYVYADGRAYVGNWENGEQDKEIRVNTLLGNPNILNIGVCSPKW